MEHINSDAEAFWEQIRRRNPEIPVDLFTKKYDMRNGVPDPYSWHYHKDVEIIYVLEGRLRLMLENKEVELSAGDIYYVDSMRMHYTKKFENVYYGCCIFPVVPFLLDAFPEGALIFLNGCSSYDFEKLLLQNPDAKVSLTDLMREMLNHQERRTYGYSLLLQADLKKMLFLLIQLFRTEENEYQNQKNEECRKIVEAVSYVNKHISEKIDLNLLCQQCHYSYHYFSKLFKQYIGVNFTEYLMRERVKLSKVYLTESDKSVSEISYDVGFPNENSFFRSFRKCTGLTPKQYREAYCLNEQKQ